MMHHAVAQFQLLEPVADTPRQLVQGVAHTAGILKQLLGQWHGTLPAPTGWRIAFVAHDGASIVAVSTWGRPVARMEDQETTLEHNRMACAPNAPRNTASWFIAQNRKWIRAHMPEIKRLIAYVDLRHHTGITYRADNWRTVYYGQQETSSWQNRPGHCGIAAQLRCKFEREP